LAAVTLMAGLYALWASFRAAFGAAEMPDMQGTVEAASRRELVAEKEALLQNLRDLRFDHDQGKLSRSDFERLDAKLRARAKQVLKLLDADVEPFREKAEALIAERIGKDVRAPYRKSQKPEDADAPTESGAAEEDAPAESTAAESTAAESTPAENAGVKACPECETENDADAVFCKKCGHRFAEAGDAEAKPESGDADDAEASSERDDAAEAEGDRA
ncbi:MAG TPA: zinc ribbon domain-containing protein, partial [Polyangiaceae bacterium LLY-WYZ-15_(1-7)]|nr:zinc ribbon domain-containing protein [Polyangiaceae bacterium LLY-WYZ-15_(1-7)]